MDFIFWFWFAPLSLGMLLLMGSEVTQLWARRQLVGQAACALFVVSVPFIFTLPLGLAGYVGLILLHSLLVILALRLVFGRLPAEFLRTSTKWNVVAAALCLSGVWILGSQAGLHLVIIALSIAIFLSLLFLRQVRWSLRKFKAPQAKPQELSALPTVSVCIPARNEDQALKECIESVLASDYPKLEVLVLDDCSQDKTADIIKSFAHSGVRFVDCPQTPADWLGKNMALATLAEHAAGDLLLFVSVDTRMGPHTIATLVDYASQNHLKMVSVLPQDHQPASLSTLLAPLHYFWHMAVPINSLQVPISSKCWLIDADALLALGGFTVAKNAILPEVIFARQLLSVKAYRFVVSDAALPMSTIKDWRSQVATAIRLLYPLVDRQPVLALSIMLVVLVPLLTPYVVLLVALFIPLPGVLVAMSVVAALLFLLCYGFVLARVRPDSWWIGMLCAPAVIAQEIVLLCVSLLGYEFSEITWKGRNVCYPVAARRESANARLARVK